MIKENDIYKLVGLSLGLSVGLSFKAPKNRQKAHQKGL